MALFTLQDIQISGIAACVPSKEVYNMDYKWISVKEREQLIKQLELKSAVL